MKIPVSVVRFRPWAPFSRGSGGFTVQCVRCLQRIRRCLSHICPTLLSRQVGQHTDRTLECCVIQVAHKLHHPRGGVTEQVGDGLAVDARYGYSGVAIAAAGKDYYVLTKKGKVYKNNKKIDDGYSGVSLAAD